jgi:hypothetical protein
MRKSLRSCYAKGVLVEFRADSILENLQLLCSQITGRDASSAGIDAVFGAAASLPSRLFPLQRHDPVCQGQRLVLPQWDAREESASTGW